MLVRVTVCAALGRLIAAAPWLSAASRADHALPRTGPLRHPIKKCPCCVSIAFPNSTPHVPALVDVSLDVERGEFVRAGRSQRLRQIHAAQRRGGHGLSDLRRGGPRWRGHIVARRGRADAPAPRESRLHLPVVPVAGVACPWWRTSSCRCCWRGAHGRVEAALDRLRQVEMEDYAARMPYQLSGGQMQRVAIARALVHAPALLLADEPTGNLDSITGDVILQLLRRIADTHQTTILMATHSVEAAALADTVVRLLDGRVLEILARRPRGCSGVSEDLLPADSASARLANACARR